MSHTPDSAAASGPLQAQWTAAAPQWIERMRGRGDPARTELLDEWMLDAAGDVAGQRVIDLGCGEGRFCRMLAERGARVTGVDLCEQMIRAADPQRITDETYLVGDMQDLAAVDSGRFDLAVSYISLVDVPDHRRAIGEAWRVLRPGGRFIVCNLAPMVTAGNTWVKYNDGTKLHFRLDNYLDESERIMPMCGVEIRNFHRTLGSYLNAFVDAGFVLEGVREPFPSPGQVARCPGNADHLRVPLFIIYLLRKAS